MIQPHTTFKMSPAGFALTLLGAILFSTKAIIVKLAFRHTAMDGLTLLAMRMLCALPFYMGAALIAGTKKDIIPLKPRQWLYIVLLGLFGYYFSSLFDFVGLQYISAGLERLILFLYPSFAILINSIIFKQPVTRLQKIALLLTYTGIAAAFWGELHIDIANNNFLWGSFLIFLCAVTFAIYIAGSGRLIPQAGATRFTAYAMLAATVGIFTHFFIAKQTGIIQLQHVNWGYGICLAIFATVLPTFMISNGMKRIGTNNVAIISAIGPVSTIIQAHFVLGEPIFAMQIAGTMLVIAGVLLTGWKNTKN
ncbi:MAG: DMT family transporter [Agriterribacter sp.]